MFNFSSVRRDKKEERITKIHFKGWIQHASQCFKVQQPRYFFKEFVLKCRVVCTVIFQYLNCMKMVNELANAIPALFIPLLNVSWKFMIVCGYLSFESALMINELKKILFFL